MKRKKLKKKIKLGIYIILILGISLTTYYLLNKDSTPIPVVKETNKTVKTSFIGDLLYE